MFDLLQRSEAAPGRTLTLEHVSSEEDTVDDLIERGYFRTVTGDNEARTVRLTPVGERALADARTHGLQHLALTQVSQPVHIQQTFHGPTTNQTGNHNVMHVTMNAQNTPLDADALIAQINVLRTLLPDVPEDDREDVSVQLDQAEKAAGKGKVDRAMQLLSTLITVGAGSVELVTKVKALLGHG